MSTNPDLVSTLSHWLAGHADIDDVERALAAPGDLGPQSQTLVAELREELTRPGSTPPKLQPLVRETIEAIALGE